MRGNWNSVVVCAALLMAACGGEDRSSRGGGGGLNPNACDVFDLDACGGENVCANSSCVPAYPRAYQITIESATVPTRDLSGECWDAGCGAPDLKVVVRLNDEILLRTATAQDVFTATFAETTTAQLTGGSRLRVTLYDEDLVEDDVVVECGSERLDGADARQRNWTCGSNGVDLTWTLVVR
jgi:hypothetical protein